MKCKNCIEAGQPECFASPRKCAFESGVFSSDNWNCDTMNRLRNIVYNNGEVCGRSSRMFWRCRDDNASASIGVIRIPENDTISGYLVMTWYKGRGRTGMAVTVEDGKAPELLTLEQAEAILDRLAEMSGDIADAMLKERVDE